MQLTPTARWWLHTHYYVRPAGVAGWPMPEGGIKVYDDHMSVQTWDFVFEYASPEPDF
ncbi:hypothetical protein CGRA01v4_09134 [Colletotrichum graminicola]|nr:hypothetical protein CGRA01v4_09134 [Colletotrichum graminicola]